MAESTGKQKKKWDFKVSWILGVIGFFILPIVFGPLAILVGVVELSKAKTDEDKKGSYVGIGLGILDLILMALLINYTLSKLGF